VTDREMKAILRWEEPPPARGPSRSGVPRGESQWADAADALRHESPAWAVLFEGSRSAANSIRGLITHGRLHCFTPTGDFEAVTRENGTGGHPIVTVYARYVGSGDE
jgi:hypothetical protein